MRTFSFIHIYKNYIYDTLVGAIGDFNNEGITKNITTINKLLV
jgi:hypothetical protein